MLGRSTAARRRRAAFALQEERGWIGAVEGEHLPQWIRQKAGLRAREAHWTNEKGMEERFGGLTRPAMRLVPRQVAQKRAPALRVLVEARGSSFHCHPHQHDINHSAMRRSALALHSTAGRRRASRPVGNRTRHTAVTEASCGTGCDESRDWSSALHYHNAHTAFGGNRNEIKNRAGAHSLTHNPERFR